MPDGARGRQLIGAAQAAVILKQETGIEAHNEAQLRPLVSLVKKSPERAAQVWRDAHAHRAATARTVEMALAQSEPKQPEAPIVAADLIALIEQVKTALIAMVDTINESNYRKDLKDEGIAAIKTAGRDALAAVRDLLKQI